MMMLGGSATIVAALPMLEAKTCASKKGAGRTSSVRQMESVMGTASTTTVALSRNADATAVSVDMRQRVPKPLPRTI